MDREALARYLSQRAELRQDPVVLEGLSREGALELARRGGRPGVSAPGGDLVTPDSAGPTPTRAAAPGGSTPETPSPAGTAADPAAAPDYAGLREMALACTRCRLSETRTQVVFSDGSPTARLVVVGEAPGANEDRTGLPFVGQAGRLLDLLLASVGLSRQDSVYICNVLKCRPPGNRNPMSDEIELCSPFLRRQIALVEPEVILAVGTFAAQLLTGQNRALGKLRGEVYSYEGVPLVVSYHPAALLRNSGWTRATWDDLQLLKQVLDGR